jgi:hypothetical protein
MSQVMERASATMLVVVRAMVASSTIPEERRVTTALYLLVTCCNVPGALAARAYDCSKQNVSKALRAVETRRDDPHYDAELARLEAMFSQG